MGNCLKPVMASREPHEQEKAEETKLLVNSTLHDQVILTNDDHGCKKRKKVRFNVQVDNAVAGGPMETIIRPGMKRSVRVKVVLTQSELKQILNRATTYHYPSSSVDQVSGQIMVKCGRSRRSPLMCRCRCCWNPALQTIPESGNY